MRLNFFYNLPIYFIKNCREIAENAQSQGGLDMGIATTGIEASGQMSSAYIEESKAKKKSNNYGRTIGSPTLSEEGQKYYEELKKKYGNMEFILVSSDMKEQAKAQAASYANPVKTVVLIDEEKIERMATDENYRKQYEGIISNAASGISQLKKSLESSGAKVKGYGMQVGSGGLTSFFAVLEKSSAAQRERINKKAADKKAEKKAAEKKAERKEAKERLEEKRTGGKEKPADSTYGSDTVTITANSIEELIQKINDYTFIDRSNQVRTEEEKAVGQYFDFRS